MMSPWNGVDTVIGSPDSREITGEALSLTGGMG
jgi:hypothetical protein